MEKPLRRIVAFAASVLWSQIAAGECVDPARKPIRISGTLCGAVLSAFTQEPLDGVVVEVVDDEHLNYPAAKVESDSKGLFNVGPLPKGKYWLQVTGFNASYPIIEVTKSTSTCGRQLFVYAQVGGDCRSYVVTKKPPRR